MSRLPIPKKRQLTFFWGLGLSVILYGFLSTLQRSQFAELVVCFTLLFVIYLMVWRSMGALPRWLILVAFVLTRLPFFFSLPELSDDYFRFLWDGLLLSSWENPFGAVPKETSLDHFADKDFAMNLLLQMNSAGYGSVYPPLHQVVFWVGAQCAEGSLLRGVNAMRAMVILSELGMVYYFIMRYTGVHFENIIAAYLLNPLVIVEGVGNLHMEAVMVPFMAIGLHGLTKDKAKDSAGGVIKAGTFYAAGILVKLTPLILTPLLFFRKGSKEKWLIAFTVASIVFIGFLPFQPWRLYSGMEGSYGLYFQNFEFNASVYYLLREVIRFFLGYNPIAFLGPALGLLTLLTLVGIVIARSRSSFYQVALYSYLIYLFLATTVHPWYILPIVYLSLAAKRPAWLIWSFTVCFSYSHYLDPQGPKWLWLLLEYSMLAIGVWVFEVSNHRIRLLKS